VIPVTAIVTGDILALEAGDAVVAMTGDGVRLPPPSKARTSASPWGDQEPKSQSRLLT